MVRQAQIERILNHLNSDTDLARALTRVYVSQIPDYNHLPDLVLTRDVRPHAEQLIKHLILFISDDATLNDAFVSVIRDSAIRRFNQGVSLESLLRSYRIWGRMVWRSVEKCVNRGDTLEVTAGLQIADRIMRYVDFTSVVISDAFHTIESGIGSTVGLVSLDVLDALISRYPGYLFSNPDFSGLVGQLSSPHTVILVRTPTTSIDRDPDSISTLVQRIHAELGYDRTIIVGLRGHELVTVYPVGAEEHPDELVRRCGRLLGSPNDAVIGIGRCHSGLAGVADSFDEASKSVTFGLNHGLRDRPVRYKEVLLEELLRESGHSRELIEDIVAPLERQDAVRGSGLLDTLKVFYDSRYNVSQSARTLCVHGNTVSYRLGRIQQLTGFDPGDPDDLLLLALALKVNHSTDHPVSS